MTLALRLPSTALESSHFPCQGITTIEADEAVASSDVMKKIKISEFDSVNLDPAESVLVFPILQVLRFSGSPSGGLSIEFSIISCIS